MQPIGIGPRLIDRTCITRHPGGERQPLQCGGGDHPHNRDQQQHRQQGRTAFPLRKLSHQPPPPFSLGQGQHETAMSPTAHPYEYSAFPRPGATDRADSASIRLANRPACRASATQFPPPVPATSTVVPLTPLLPSAYCAPPTRQTR